MIDGREGSVEKFESECLAARAVQMRDSSAPLSTKARTVSGTWDGGYRVTEKRKR